MSEVKDAAERRKLAAWRRLLSRLAPDRIADGRLPTDARALLHLLDGTVPGLEGEAALEWEYLLQAYLGLRGARVSSLSHPLVWVHAALGEWHAGRVEPIDLERELWSDLSTRLGPA